VASRTPHLHSDSLGFGHTLELGQINKLTLKPGSRVESIGLFDAKTHLSELVARAERGEEVIITRHNKPVAKLVPIDGGELRARDKRQEALRALKSFDRIKVAGASVLELIHAGRR
jgi:prevent-host-death family protein